VNAPLEARWTGLLTALGCAPEPARRGFADLAARYSSPERHYHTLDHVRDVLDTAAPLWGGAGPPPALLLAAWLHDVVYDTRAADNEERSADHAGRCCGRRGWRESCSTRPRA
jgi:predicted metal-dependent HD superfamily phosphohydrolase